MSIRDLVAPHKGRHTPLAIARRLVDGPKRERAARPERACEGACPCHTDQTTQRSPR